jgi:hypothetical protein
MYSEFWNNATLTRISLRAKRSLQLVAIPSEAEEAAAIC